jgi:SAM-dependent methyltransferase
VARALAARPDFDGLVIGVDQSPLLLDITRRLAGQEGVAERIELRVDDAERLDLPDASFDAVIAHTTISHVGDPLALLREAARVVRPGGQVVIFDGDYASWTFDHPDPQLAATMDAAIIAAVVNNPRVLRSLPRLLRQAGLELAETQGYVYADIGAGSFFGLAIETYVPMTVRAGIVPAAQAETWLADQRQAMADDTFFGACNYYTYVAHRPATPATGA